MQTTELHSLIQVCHIAHLGHQLRQAFSAVIISNQGRRTGKDIV